MKWVIVNLRHEEFRSLENSFQEQDAHIRGDLSRQMLVNPD